MRHRRAAVAAHRALFAGVSVPVEGRIDGAFRTVGRAPDQSQITALDSAFGLVGELGRERAMGHVGLGHHHQAAGVLVEPVHDAGPFDAADAGQAVAAMGDQRIDQRAFGVAGGGMHDQALRLVDDDERVILVDNIQRDGFAGRFWRFGRGQSDGDGIAGIDGNRRDRGSCGRRPSPGRKGSAPSSANATAPECAGPKRGRAAGLALRRR